MNKICTSIEQSKKLVELGIDVNTADVCYHIYPCKELTYEILLGVKPIDDDIPAWSLAALLDILPKQIGRYTKTLYWFDDAWHCEYVDEDSEGKYGGTADNPVNACVEMIIKLKEDNLL